jgi:hypothetical protein
MLPKNKLRDDRMMRLRLFDGPEHDLDFVKDLMVPLRIFESPNKPTEATELRTDKI